MTVRGVRPGERAYPPYFPSGYGLLARELVAANSEYLHVNSSPVTAAPVTFGCWWRPANTTTQSEFFSLANSGAAASFCAIGSRSDGSDFRARYRNVTSYVWGGILVANTWYHVTARFTSATDQDIFTNGSSVDGNPNKAFPAGVNRVTFGRLGDSSPSNYSDGDVAQAFIYNVALSDVEIQQLANGAYPWEIRPQNLVGLWLVGPRSDRDFSGYGYHMTAFNTPTWVPGSIQKLPSLVWDTSYGLSVAAVVRRIFITQA